MLKREAFLAAACKENAEDFLRFIQLHNDKTEPFDVEEVVQEMPRDQRDILWARMSLLLQEVLSKLPPQRWDEKKSEGPGNMDVESSLDSVGFYFYIMRTLLLKICRESNPATVILGVVANIFQKIIELLARHLRKNPEEGQQLCQSSVAGLADFLQTAQTWDRAPLNGVFSTLFAVIVVEKRYKLNKISYPEEVIVPETLDDMPPLPSILLSTILKSPSVTKSFLAEIISSLDSEAIESLTEVAAVLHILAVIKHSTLKEMHVTLILYFSVTRFCFFRVIYESSVKTINDILDL
uniref:Uncharacterized protein n=1 Tax=Periophthalmus magnuspinnatus TaxID=409849 RepID=A0A3B3ZEW2_9GOBI